MKNKTVLVADDDPDILDLMQRRCTHLGLNVVLARDAMTAMSQIAATHPDLVCLDVEMPNGTGLSVCKTMAADADLKAIPAIILTGRSDQDVQRQCHDLIAYYIPKGQQMWQRLEPLLEQILGPASTEEPVHKDTVADNAELSSQNDRVEEWRELVDLEPIASDLPAAPKETAPWILSIDDDSTLTFALKVRLARHGVNVLRAMRGQEGYRYAYLARPSLILLDYEMPDVDGEYLLRRIRQTPELERVPVIILTGHKQKSLERRLLCGGANAFLNKPLRWEDLSCELTRHIPMIGIAS
ncbi:MAG: response regulator [Planctomycetales bacterium]|nr:response regulator [Planctomycetales bacterium]